MGGETEQNESGWTTDTLRYHMQRQIDDLRGLLDERHAAQTTAMNAALAAAEKAVAKAETAAEKRFESVNEFRSALTDAAARNVTRSEFDAAVGRNAERIDELRDRINRSEGRGVGLNAGWVYLLGGVSALAALFAIVVALTR